MNDDSRQASTQRCTETTVTRRPPMDQGDSETHIFSTSDTCGVHAPNVRALEGCYYVPSENI
jgi:hypothetical protein